MANSYSVLESKVFIKKLPKKSFETKIFDSKLSFGNCILIFLGVCSRRKCFIILIMIDNQRELIRSIYSKTVSSKSSLDFAGHKLQICIPFEYLTRDRSQGCPIWLIRSRLLIKLCLLNQNDIFLVIIVQNFLIWD